MTKTHQSDDFTRGRVSVLRDFHNLCAADHFMGFSSEEFAAVKKFIRFNENIIDYSDEWEHTPLPPRTFCIEIHGGLVEEVYGLRDGEDYEVADYDNDDGDEARTAANNAMIARAKLIDHRY